jgi:hypothetical protein
MRLAKLVVGAFAAIALLTAGFCADAKGGRGGGHGGGHAAGHGGGHHSHSNGMHQGVSQGSSHYHGGHGYGGFFFASTFVIWPAAYYWPDYYPAAMPVVEYWYYCQPYAAYYPYVQECPAEWQPVLPTAPSSED